MFLKLILCLTLLAIVAGKTKINFAPENFEVAAGQPATFRCDAETDPSLQLNILWLFNEESIDVDSNTRMVQASDGSLTITETVYGDSGTYTCVAKTELDQDEANATLIVQDTPNPPRILGVQCDRLTSLVTWQPNGDRRAPIISYTIQYNTSFTPDEWEDASVNIPAHATKFKVSMTPWSNYTFRVIALNRIGPSEPSGHSEVCTTPADVPYKNPDNVIGKGTEKDNLVISWTAMPMIEQNAPGFFYKIYWKREDIPEASWQIVENPEWENNSLIIPNQPTFKPYRIKVEAHNVRGHARTAATEVIGYSGEDVPLEEPKNFQLLYLKGSRSAAFSWDPVSPESVRGHFRGYKIQIWTTDEGEEHLREQVVKANVTQSLVTIFRPFSRNVVRVLAFNDMYMGPPSEIIEFTTPESRKTKIYFPPENSEVAAGKLATFRCGAEADLSLQLNTVWLFNGKSVDMDSNTRMVQASDGSLTITKTVEGDSGTYTCVAKTELDQDEASATLIVQDTPNPPRMLGVQCDRLTSLVMWQPNGDCRAPIISYTIQYNTSFTPDEWEDASVNIPAPETKFKVSMTPWANYTFRVIARNRIGPSEPSGHSEVCTTPADVPYKNPDNVIGKGTEKDNLVITWTAMPMIEQNAPGFFYKIYWKREDISEASWQIAENSEWENNSLIIPNQPTFKPYRIKVEAHNVRGQARSAATEVIGYSGEDVPLEEPKNFKLLYVNMDGRSAVLSWDPVSSESVRGHFRGYKIRTWTTDEGEERLREQIVKANVTQSLVTLFRPFSRNIVYVLAFNDMYTGPPSEVIEFTTPEGTPGPVAYFDGIPLGSTALHLIWRRPTEPNGILTGYNIYYREEPDEPNFLWSLLLGVHDKAEVRVTWIPAYEGNPGSHFFVQYRKKGESTWESSPSEENQDSILVQGLEWGYLYEMRVVSVDGPFQASSKIEEFFTGGMLKQ